MRRLLGFLLVLAVAGCGSEDPPEPALDPVRLQIDTPTDLATVEIATVQVSGSVVPPEATVRVAGDDAAVVGGRFEISVDLDPGANVIDVEAGAPRRPAAMTALRVVREVPVEVPDVEGLSPQAAVTEIEGAGLRATVDRQGGLLDDLLPGSIGVCGTDPDAGERVRSGTEVVVGVAKTC